MPFLPPQTTHSGRPTATLGQRVVAHLLDTVIQGAVQTAVLSILVVPDMLAAFETLPTTNTSGTITGTAEVALALFETVAAKLILAVAVAWIVGGVIETVTVARWGGSPGKLLTGLRIIDADTGTYLRWQKAAARWLGLSWTAPAGLVVPLVTLIPTAGYLAAWFDPKRRALHDRLVDAVVVTRDQPAAPPPPTAPSPATSPSPAPF